MADRRCIFIHIPKSAGVSIAKSLFGDLAAGHTTARQYQRVFNKKDFTEFFKFTFVRNPWDRVFSAYCFLRAGGMKDADRQWAMENLGSFDTFEEFVHDGLHTHHVQNWIHFKPQMHYLLDFSGNINYLDFLGFFENLSADFRYVAQRLLPDGKAPLQAHNVTTGKEVKYVDAYKPEMIKRVEDIYSDDVSRLGYTFDNSSLSSQLAARGDD